jgi:amino acid transporter
MAGAKMPTARTPIDSEYGRPASLRRNELSLAHIVASTLANIAPAMSFFFAFSVIVRGSGLAAILTIILATVAILFLTNTVAEFSRFMPSAGSFVTFTGKAFGPTVGTSVSLFALFGYVVTGSTVVAIAGVWIAQTCKAFLDISMNWTITTTLVTLATGWLVVRGVKVSTLWAGVFFFFEGSLLAIAAIAMIASHAKFMSVAPLFPSNISHGLAGIGAGFPVAVYLFIGWENSAALAEETARPRHNIPRALIISAVLIGLFYVLLAYATTVAFRLNVEALGASQIPFIDGLKASAPSLLVLAYLAGITSIVSSFIAWANFISRTAFNSGRERLLPKILGRLHSQYQTPHVAIWVCLAIAIVLTLGFCWLGNVAPLDYFGYAATLGTIPLIVIYMLTNLALPVYVMREHRAEFDRLRHLALPLLGTAVMVFPVWGLIQPGQSWPFRIFPGIALAVLGLSLVYGIIVGRRPRELGRWQSTDNAEIAKTHP